MISKARLLPSASAISATSGVMLPASLRTGTTMETAGRASLSRFSLMTIATRSLGGMARASYGATSCRATLLMRAKDGPGSARMPPSAPDTKPSRRAANQSRTSSAPDEAEDGAGQHVAGMVRREHDPAHRDQHRVGPQQRAQPRPQRADRDAPPRTRWWRARTAGSHTRRSSRTAGRGTGRHRRRPADARGRSGASRWRPQGPARRSPETRSRCAPRPPPAPAATCGAAPAKPARR